jgi:inosine-uridine nucleoside N-ribohydrolase
MWQWTRSRATWRAWLPAVRCALSAASDLPRQDVALGLRSAPDIAERLGGIAFMGGGTTFGNVTPSAEFNILVDPEAAAVVVGCGAELLMAGLDVTHQWLVDGTVTRRIHQAGGRAAGFCAALLDYYRDAYARAFSGEAAGPLHDPCAVLALTHPLMFERRASHVEVETTGTHTRGMTVVDLRPWRHGTAERSGADDQPLSDVALEVDAEAARTLLRKRLTGEA